MATSTVPSAAEVARGKAAFPWVTVAVTLKGTAKRPVEECQDHADAWRVDLPSSCVLAVADGAGSTARGGEGAARLVAAVRGATTAKSAWKGVTAGETALDRLEAIVERTVEATLAALRAQIGDDDVRDFASTLAVALVMPRFVAIAAIGDAFACVRRDADPSTALLVLPPGRDARRSGTHFFTSKGWRKHLRVCGVGTFDVTGVILSTDGLEEVAIEYAHLLYAHDGPDFARPLDVYFMPTMLELVDDGMDSDGLAEELSAPEIMEAKGDDVGVALAVRGHGVPERPRQGAADHSRRPGR